MKQMTEQHLINAFGGESMAHVRYHHFGNQAEKEKLNNLSSGRPAGSLLRRWCNFYRNRHA